MRKNILALLFVFLTIVFISISVSAITLGPNLTLTTNSSNSSITFSIPVNVTEADIYESNITLYNVRCSNQVDTFGGPDQTIPVLIYDTADSTVDILSYCNPTTAVQNTLATSGFCSGVTSGLGGFFSNMGTIFAVLGLLVVIGVIIVFARVAQDDTFDPAGYMPGEWSGLSMAKIAMIAVLGIALFGFLFMALFGTLCA